MPFIFLNKKKYPNQRWITLNWCTRVENKRCIIIRILALYMQLITFIIRRHENWLYRYSLTFTTSHTMKTITSRCYDSLFIDSTDYLLESLWAIMGICSNTFWKTNHEKDVFIKCIIEVIPIHSKNLQICWNIDNPPLFPKTTLFYVFRSISSFSISV